MASDAAEIGGVDEELALSDADRQEVGDVVVGDGVAIARPVDVAIDAADAIDDASGIVVVGGEREEMLLLVGEALEGGGAVAATLIDDTVQPVGELGLDVGEVAEGATVEERSLELPEAALDAGLAVGIPPHGLEPELVVGGEGEEARVVDGLVPFPAQHDGLLAIVHAGLGAPLESGEGADVAVHQRMEVIRLVHVVGLAGAVTQRVLEGL